jgi:PKD repeat protein
VKLTVINACSTDSETKTIYVLSVEENELVGLNVYPNPASEYLRVELTEYNSFNIVITDISGKVLLEKNASSSEIIDVSNFAPGLYNISISSENAITNQKIIIR